MLPPGVIPGAVGDGVVALGLAAIILQPGLIVPLAHVMRLWWRLSTARRLWWQLRPGSRRRGDAHASGHAPALPGAPAGGTSPHRIRLPGPYLDIAIVWIGLVMALGIGSGRMLDPPATLPLGLVTVMAGIFDLRWFWLPDRITLPLIALGVLQGISHDQAAGAGLGLIAGGGVFLLVRMAYQAFRGVEGLGLGDVKFAAAMGAWLGPDRLPEAIALAAVLAIAVTLVQSWQRARRLPDRRVPIPFGAFLAFALWAVWLTSRI